MNKSIRFGPILFLLLTGYILSSCKTTVFVQNAPTPNATAVATATVDPLATPSLDLTATLQVTGTPFEDDDEFGNLTGIVGLVTFKDGKIKIYITLNGVDKIIVREAEKSDHSGDNSGDDSGKKDGDSH
jgi:hypothetical protein